MVHQLNLVLIEPICWFSHTWCICFIFFLHFLSRTTLHVPAQSPFSQKSPRTIKFQIIPKVWKAFSLPLVLRIAQSHICGSEASYSWRPLFLTTNALLPHHMQFCHEVAPHSLLPLTTSKCDNLAPSTTIPDPCDPALPRRTWYSITRPDPIPEVELEKCETREIIIVLFFPVVLGILR